MALRKWLKKLGSSDSGSGSRPSTARRREERPPPAQPPQPPPEPSIYDDEDEDYDQPIHDFEQAQEDYLMSVALATSASEYEFASKRQSDTEDSGFAIKAPSASSIANRGEALAFKFWGSGRCALLPACLLPRPMRRAPPRKGAARTQSPPSSHARHGLTLHRAPGPQPGVRRHGDGRLLRVLRRLP